jgi:hypothetical protein
VKRHSQSGRLGQGWHADGTAIGVQSWEEAWLGDRIELRIAPALKTLRRLPHEEDIDLVFIDADTTGYVDYWDELVPCSWSTTCREAAGSSTNIPDGSTDARLGVGRRLSTGGANSSACDRW